MNIYFDMDGTIADLYGFDNWLEHLQNEDVQPYQNAKPLVNMNVLARSLNRLQRKGVKIGIISWTSKQGSQEYNSKVTETKKRWLHKHLKSVQFDEIHIVEYGTPKSSCGGGILFDDELRNRKEWNGTAFNEKEIFYQLKKIEKALTIS